MIRRKISALALSACLVFISAGFKGCSQDQKSTFDAYARDVAQALVDSQPLVDQILISKGKRLLAQKYDLIVPAGQRLVAAIAASDKTEAIQIVAQIIPTLEEVAASFTDRTDVLAGLAIANIALHFLVNHLPDQAVAQAGAAGPGAARQVSVVTRFKMRKEWRCRNSATGRFEKMDFCKANPSTSTVETF